MSSDWSGALDDFGRALINFEERLEVEPAETVSFGFRLPADLGPLPPDLLEVAIRLADMSQHLEDRVRQLLSDIMQEQMAVTRARSQAAPVRPRPRFVDVSG